MRTIILAGVKADVRIVAAVDCDEVTRETEKVLRSVLLRRIAEKLNPVALMILKQSPDEIFDYLLNHGWKFETYEQFNEARILETPQQEKKE